MENEKQPTNNVETLKKKKARARDKLNKCADEKKVDEVEKILDK